MGKFNRFALKEDGNYEFTLEDIEDEETTLDLAMSSLDGHELGSLTKHPRDRRLNSERVALYTFIAFIVVMFIGLIPLSWKKSRDRYMFGDGLQPLGQKDVIQCNGSDKKTSLNDWLRQDMQNISTLCDPHFLGQSQKAYPARTPVKVFIMLGEANMVGAGLIEGDVEGSLEYTVYTKNRFSHLKSQDQTGWEIPRMDVRYVAVHNDFEVVENNWLQINEARGYFGPEVQFGYVMGEIFDEPVLVIKAAHGRNSLGGEMLPPGSEPFEYDGYVYAGYGDSPRKWEPGTSRIATSWRAGAFYDQNVDNAKRILRNINAYYPGASTYEIAG
jgi:hypothetical protein